MESGLPCARYTHETAVQWGVPRVSNLRMVHMYMLIEDARCQRQKEHDGHECSSISASILKPPLPTLSQHRPPTNDLATSPSPRLPSSRPPVHPSTLGTHRCIRSDMAGR